MQNISAGSTHALQTSQVAQTKQLSWMSQLAEAVVVTEALQSAADETLAKALSPEGKDSATLTALAIETSALDVWMALTSELIRANKDRLKDTVRSFSPA